MYAKHLVFIPKLFKLVQILSSAKNYPRYKLLRLSQKKSESLGFEPKSLLKGTVSIIQKAILWLSLIQSVFFKKGNLPLNLINQKNELKSFQFQFHSCIWFATGNK